jgi:hypothetical protein
MLLAGYYRLPKRSETMNFSDNKTNWNHSEGRGMSPSRNREIEVAQAGLRRAYVRERQPKESMQGVQRRSLVQVLVNLVTFWMR